MVFTGLQRFINTRFESERDGLLVVAARSQFDALLRMGIFALLALSLVLGFDDITFAYWFVARVITTLIAGLTISKFKKHPTTRGFAAVFCAYVLDALPFFWLVAYLWLSYVIQYQVIAVLMLAAGFIYSLTHRLRVPSLGLIYVGGIQASFTLFWATVFFNAQTTSDIALGITIMGLQLYHALTMRETFATLAAIDRNARRSEAERRLQAMGRVAGGVAHAFNNHLAAVVCGIDVARNQTAGADVAKSLTLALKAAQQAGTDVERLLAYTHQFPLRPTSIDLGEVMEDVHTSFSKLGFGSVKVHQAISRPYPKLRVDRDQLQIAMLELLQNAAAAGASEIWIRSETVDAGEPRIEISVSDNGTGVSPDIAERIFEPFFSGSETTQNPGLGLPMVRGFVEQSGGRVLLDHSSSVGATLVLSFPVN